MTHTPTSSNGYDTDKQTTRRTLWYHTIQYHTIYIVYGMVWYSTPYHTPYTSAGSFSPFRVIWSGSVFTQRLAQNKHCCMMMMVMMGNKMAH
eukprot:scaffold3014_cov172-Amphora_coffeaeformis.AAC.7